jgi:hypothetical protein
MLRGRTGGFSAQHSGRPRRQKQRLHPQTPAYTEPSVRARTSSSARHTSPRYCYFTLMLMQGILYGKGIERAEDPFRSRSRSNYSHSAGFVPPRDPDPDWELVEALPVGSARLPARPAWGRARWPR